MSFPVFTLFLATLTGPAAPPAYIDPNTGGMLFQILVVIFATFSGILFFFSRQIKSLFARGRRKLRGGTPEETPSEDNKPEDRPD